MRKYYRPKQREILFQVTTPYYCAGLVIVENIVTEAAPILHWTKGLTYAELFNYCRRKQWKFQKVTSMNDDRSSKDD